MKKTIILILAAFMLAAMCACTGDGNVGTASPSPSLSASASAMPTDDLDSDMDGADGDLESSEIPDLVPTESAAATGSADAGSPIE